MAQLGGEELKPFVKCIMQGILVDHHDRTRAISCIIKSGILRGKSRTRQTSLMLGNRRSGKICLTIRDLVGCIQ